MSRVPLTALLRKAWDTARSLGPSAAGLGPREAAAAIALTAWGQRSMSVPGLVNIAAWGWCARGRAVVHTVRPSVPRLVAATDLHQLPDAPPALLTSPWCVEVGRPERGERLWGDTWGLAGYEVDGVHGVHYLIGLEGDACRVVPWRPQWSGRDLSEGVVTSHMDAAAAELGITAMVDDDEHARWAVDAARAAVVYGLLLDAAGAPVRVTDEGAARARNARERALAEAWSTSRVTLTPEGERVVTAPPPAGESEPFDLAGRVPAVARVRAHLKRQRHGAGNALVRWIFVEGYAARRWVAPWSTRDVRGGGKPS